MQDVIKIKRGLSADLANADLVEGEPAFCLDTKKFYVYDGSTPILINPTVAVPTKTSDLVNDSNFIKIGDTKTIDGGTF